MSSPSSASAPKLDDEAMKDLMKTMLYHTLLEKRLVPPKELGIPLKQVFPGDWNWHFQRAYHQKYDDDADLEAWKRENYDFGRIAYIADVPRCNQDIVGTSKVLLEKEGELVALAIEQLVDRDFEAAWGTLEVETKRDLVLDGLVRAAFKAREESRFDCPEMSLFGLIGDGEYNLINLLKVIVAHDPTGNLRVKSLYLFTHPAVEREYSYTTNPDTLESLRAFGYLRIIQRNLYIVQALIDILEAYAGKPAPKISINQERESKQRQCQVRDWDEHKKLCGKRPMKFDPALVTPTPEAPPEFIGCPAPAPGFVRSPMLWRQIWYLSKEDSCTRDYHFDTTPGHTRSIRIPDPVLRLVFLVARRRAMASGGRGAVCKMHDVLSRLQRAGVLDLTPEQITSQLEREYRVALSPAEPLGALPTAQEMCEELVYAGRRDHLSRDAEWEVAEDVVGGEDEDEEDESSEGVSDEAEAEEDTGSEGVADDSDS
ncbi:hypothetical protein C8R44DRAFT_848189 [Mycena epipterygia]|nr:hypothetical protein C8R44DRAFT_848189 [Mycena epipterygia]